jgi:hypothetical protein
MEVRRAVCYAVRMRIDTKLDGQRKWIRAATKETRRRCNCVKLETDGYGGEVGQLHNQVTQALELLERISLLFQ